MVFMDHQNFIIAFKNYYKGLGLYEPKIDYDKLSRNLVDKIPIEATYIKTFIFAPKADDFLIQNPKWQNYENLIRGVGLRTFIDVVESRMTARPKESNISWEEMDINNPLTYQEYEKGTDVNLAINLISKAFFNSYDTAIVLSGDSDYINAFQILNTMGKNIISVGVYGQNIKRLAEYSDYYMLLDDKFFKECTPPQFK